MGKATTASSSGYFVKQEMKDDYSNWFSSEMLVGYIEHK
jgi:hypothetical protein